MAGKTLRTIAILIVASLIPISAMAGGRTLCDLFDEPGGNFRVFYDLRGVNSGDTIYQNPQGGIKFSLELRLYETEIERDAFLYKIKKVVLFNMTTGDRYVLKSPDTYTYLNYFSGEYSLHIGSTRHVLGVWKVIAYAGRWWVPYRAYFTITEDMLDLEAPIPVEVTGIVNLGNGYLRVTCDDEGADQYILRVFNSEGGIPWQTNMTCDGIICEADVPDQYEDYRARIEARINDQLWPMLMQWNFLNTCNPHGMIKGSGQSRSITWFDIDD